MPADPLAAPPLVPTSRGATWARDRSDKLSEASYIAPYVTQWEGEDTASNGVRGDLYVPRQPADVLRGLRYGVAPSTLRANKKWGMDRAAAAGEGDDEPASAPVLDAALQGAQAEALQPEIVWLKDLVGGLKKWQAGSGSATPEAAEAKLDELLGMLRPKATSRRGRRPGTRGEGEDRRARERLPGVALGRAGGVVGRHSNHNSMRNIIPARMEELRQLDAHDFLAQYRRALADRQKQILDAARADEVHPNYIELNRANVTARRLHPAPPASPPWSPLHAPSAHARKVAHTRRRYQTLLATERDQRAERIRTAPTRLANARTRVHDWLSFIVMVSAGRAMHARFAAEAERVAEEQRAKEPDIMNILKKAGMCQAANDPDYKVRVTEAARFQASTYIAALRLRLVKRHTHTIRRWLDVEKKKNVIHYIQVYKAHVRKCQRIVRNWLSASWVKTDLWRAQLEAVEAWVGYLHDHDVAATGYKDFRKAVEQVMLATKPRSKKSVPKVGRHVLPSVPGQLVPGLAAKLAKGAGTPPKSPKGARPLNVRVVVPFAVAQEALAETARQVRQHYSRERRVYEAELRAEPGRAAELRRPHFPTLLSLEQIYDLHMLLCQRVEQAAKERVVQQHSRSRSAADVDAPPPREDSGRGPRRRRPGA